MGPDIKSFPRIHVSTNHLHVLPNGLDFHDTMSLLTAESIRKQQEANLEFAEEAIKLIPTGGIIEEHGEKKVLPHGQGTVYVKTIDIKKGQLISYPLEWFGKNKWVKPTLTVPIVTDKTSAIGMMGRMISAIDGTEPISSETIRCFLYKIMSREKNKLGLDWVTMGVVIGTNGSVISPFDLVNLKKVPGPEQEDVSAATATDHTKDFYSFATLITGTFRICSASNASYQTNLTAQLTRILEGTPFKSKIEGAKISMVDAFNDDELVKLFAVLDMYFNMFPKSLYAKVRVGTIILSYKDCSALSSAAHGASIMLKTTAGFSRWLLTPALRCDFYRLNIPCQEVSRPYSYMPYMMALKLAERSPYSASANPTLHLFVHLIGCAYHIKRSLNALYVDPKGVKSILSNVFLFVYAHERTRDLDPQYYATEECENVKTIRDYYKRLAEEEAKDMADLAKGGEKTGTDDKADKGSDKQDEEKEPSADDFNEGENPTNGEYEYEDRFIENEPSTQDPIAWVHHLHHFKGAVPAFMREVTYEAWGKIEDPRPNTVGEYARDLGRNA